MNEPRRQVDDDRPTPERMLEQVRREVGTGARGRLQIFLGMAPGVGKTVEMLREGQRLRDEAVDVVIGFVETHGRLGTLQALGDLEVVPRRQIEYHGVTVEEMDPAAIIQRAPDVALVDELAHTNAPGSAREKRWQDVADLLQAGITVLSTVNIQHLESLADIVEAITGVQVRERIPDHVIDQADDIEIVDITPEALRERLQAGHIYPPERAERAMQQFFRPGNLIALRELALRQVSTNVAEALQAYMHGHHIDEVWPVGDRVMVCVGPGADNQHLLRRGWRTAHGLKADLLAVFVEPPNWLYAPSSVRVRLDDDLRFAEDLGAMVLRVAGKDVAADLARVACEENVTRIVIGQSRHGRLYTLFRGSIVTDLLRLARNADVLVVGEADRTRRRPD